MAMQTELDVYIRARYPLLWVVTPEEKRALATIDRLAQQQRKRLLVWSVTTGIHNPALPDRFDSSKRDPLTLLAAILEDPEPGIWVLRDFHPFLRDAAVVRRLREVAFGLEASPKTVILLGPVLKIPPELEKEITVVDFNLPTAEQLGQMLDQIIASLEQHEAVEVSLDRRQRGRLIQACLGLTEQEAANAVAKAVVQAGGRLDGDAIEAVTAEKQQIIRKSGLLEFYASEERLANVGGLDVLKEWLRKRVRAFSDEARAFGLPEPKGILLVGVQGCGKSLVAKSVANSWRLPLLRLDVGRLFSSLVGSSEENLRNAIRVAESIAPVVLWVDEIEKGFSGVGSSNVSDAGTAARVFGSFITWLQEKQAPVFVIATANSVEQLPPELVRKGRFDEIFFVDLPDIEERREIWKIHLRKRNRDPEQFDLHSLAMASDGLSGAEIEQAVIAGLYEAFDKNRPLETTDLLDVLQETVPLSQMMQEEIDALRAWARQRARPASSRRPFG
ncbi:AAA family ATPase [Litorilinea aerophila]|nr:AAA family ATPase [Litorilinea aerophila]MCC9075093.1 AAA family ATPase [Litorilinea aerophila]GIV79882.1 MAG: ATPase AAA [Litorilinea sp.]